MFWLLRTYIYITFNANTKSSKALENRQLANFRAMLMKRKRPQKKVVVKKDCRL